MQPIKTEKQTELLQGLSITPLKKTITVPVYMKELRVDLTDFQQEMDYNVAISTSAKEILDYLSKLKIMFQDALMFFEGSFELLLFPDDINENCKKQRAYSFKKANILIYKMAIQCINQTIDNIKYSFENNILFENIKQLSKYVIINETCNPIDIVELGYALYYTGFFINRTGEALILRDFIENFGRFFGIEIKNLRQRLQELRVRIKSPLVFLQQLMNTLIINLKHEK